ncbi:nitrate reductase [Craterilacuibacter sp. RT1T]|uniref:nitrate reductase n=1 Tax=Craterilacuibacter sp. RT1T TaxID=2942211 RepID=UPI0020C048EF|nr:nitrate reductase [Craterilacuibacter sp. RT1T]MCL6263294.1 molybdopterin-dependent oxidoreductase [Craterilacuibacter sp. RT1T]
MDKTVSSVCCYCGTGCGVMVTARGDQVISVQGDIAHPANYGRLCSKGRTLGETVRRDHVRVLSAMMRPTRDMPLQAMAREAAFDEVAARLAAIIQKHGPEAVGFYLSGQLLTEDYVSFNKLARALVGTNHIDSNSRLCMSSAVSGYKMTLGADAPPACYEDLEHADCVLIAGANMAYAHPVLFRRLEDAKAKNPALRIIVIDPRRTESTSIADLHLAIHPGTDVALFHAMLNVLVWEGLVDEDYIARHTEGFAALKARIHEFTPKAAAEVCGIAAADIVQAARWFGMAGAALSLYTMGLNQSSSGTAKNAALIHLHLATGQIGKPGAGPFSLTGQPNAMGGREAGGMATLLPGHRDPANASHRTEVAQRWGIPSLPATPGATAVEMFDALLDKRIKAIWIVATNPAASLPEQARVRAALQAAELVIVSEAFASADTLAFADWVLPAATWPEKDGTMTNSERRISRVRAAISPPGDALPDWQIACDIGARLARLIAPDKEHLFTRQTPSAIFAAHAACTAGRDLDYSALSYAVLEQDGPQQWPYRHGQSQARLYRDGVFATPNGKAQFFDTGYQPVAEAVSAHYPFKLSTGRLRDHWHTTGRTGLVAALTRHVEEPALGMHPSDVARLKRQAGDLVQIKSRRGALVLPVVCDDSLRPGHVFLPMHWGRGWMAGDGINVLTSRALDPYSKQPELKHAAVAITPAALHWQAQGFIQGDAALLRGALQSWLLRFPYAVLLPVAEGGGGIRLRLAGPGAPDAATLAELAQAFSLAQPDAALDDPARGILRRLQLNEVGKPHRWLLCGDTRAAPAFAVWADGGPAPASLAAFFSGQTVSERSPLVCACTGVRQDAICSAANSGLDLAGVKQTLGCGSVCGSCVPQIVRLLEEVSA